MRAVGWSNGSRDTASPSGYGVKFTPADRDRHLDPERTAVVLELDGGPTVEVELTPSFWRNCSELRSPEIGRWLLSAGRAPWAAQNPPSIAVNAIEGNRFSARLLSPPRQF